MRESLIPALLHVTLSVTLKKCFLLTTYNTVYLFASPLRVAVLREKRCCSVPR